MYVPYSVSISIHLYIFHITELSNGRRDNLKTPPAKKESEEVGSPASSPGNRNMQTPDENKHFIGGLQMAANSDEPKSGTLLCHNRHQSVSRGLAGAARLIMRLDT